MLFDGQNSRVSTVKHLDPDTSKSLLSFMENRQQIEMCLHYRDIVHLRSEFMMPMYRKNT